MRAPSLYLVEFMAFLLILGLVVLALFLYFKFFKIPKLKNVIFVDGSLGTGKTFYSVYIAIKLYKRALFRYKIGKKLACLPYFSKKLRNLEEPVLYSNLPLANVKHSPLTLDVLLRQVRIPYKSIVLIDEISIVVDQFDYKNREISDALRDFFKLYRHETHGGYIVINSQSTSDLHYSIKSVLSDYLYIHHKTRLPFVSALSVQEMAYSSDKDGMNIMNAHNGDIEDTLKVMLVWNKYHKFYDTYHLSILTDLLPVYQECLTLRPSKGDSLKSHFVLTFKEGRYDIHEQVI